MPKRSRQHISAPSRPRPRLAEARLPYEPSQLETLPVTYQAILDYFKSVGNVNAYLLRKETMLRIEQLTGRYLMCYVTKTHDLQTDLPAYIDYFDLTGISDLTTSTSSKNADVLIVSNGGLAEAAERIVKLLRSHFDTVRFIIPHNAYSAATLICFSGNEIIMGPQGTLGPIDPQFNGIPARAILRAFRTVEERLKAEGPEALTAYMPLLKKLDLHTLEICKSAEDLSKELASTWLSKYMFLCPETDSRVVEIVDFFSSYDLHKSHARGIDREKARALGLFIQYTETTPGLADLIQSLHNQYELMFDKSPFFKLYEDGHSISWGRNTQALAIQMPPQ